MIDVINLIFDLLFKEFEIGVYYKSNPQSIPVDEYVVLNQTYDKVTQSGTDVTTRNTQILLKYYYKTQNAVTETGRKEIFRRIELITQLLKSAGFSTGDGFCDFEENEISDHAILACTFGFNQIVDSSAVES